MFSKDSKTSDARRLLINLTDKIEFRKKDKYNTCKLKSLAYICS